MIKFKRVKMLVQTHRQEIRIYFKISDYIHLFLALVKSEISKLHKC